jgi:hypothetical protein
MKQEDIIRMAREAGLHYSGRCTLTGMESHIERFAALVASAEREACAKDLDDASEAAKDVDPQGFVWRAVKDCADAIRARGQA